MKISSAPEFLMDRPSLPRRYAETMADRIQEAHTELSARWLAALNAVIPLQPNQIFPSGQLLDHIPAVLHEIGGYLRRPASEAIAANTSVVAKAQELGLMRHAQKASVHQLLREYEILGRVLDEFVQEETTRLALEPPPEECIEVMIRLHRATQILMQVTIDTFISEYTETIQRQTERLKSFNRTVSHELRNPLNTLQLALMIFQREPETSDGKRWPAVMKRNVDYMMRLIDDLDRLTRADAVADTPTHQSVEIAAVAEEVFRQLGEMASSRRVELRVVSDLPAVHVDAARLELVLMNLVSNAIKYADPARSKPAVEIGRAEASEGRVAIFVSDNGLGIPAEDLDHVFERFYRAHTERDGILGNDGSGLGLAIVRECVEALQGTVRVQSSPGIGTTFVVDLPHRTDPSGSGASPAAG